MIRPVYLILLPPLTVLVVSTGCISFNDGQSLPEALKIPEMKRALATAKSLDQKSQSLDSTAVQFDSQLTSVSTTITRIRVLSVNSAMEELLVEIQEVKAEAEEVLRLGNELITKAELLKGDLPTANARYRDCAVSVAMKQKKKPSSTLANATANTQPSSINSPTVGNGLAAPNGEV